MPNGFPQHGISEEQFLSFLGNYLRQIFGGDWRAKLPIGWLEDKVNAELENIRRDIQTSGFGPHTPYYNDVLQYYSQVASYMQPLIQQYQAFQPEPAIGGYEVEAQGGYNFAIVRDDAGNIIDIRSLGVAEPEGLSAWQQSQINRWQQEFEAQQEQTQMQFQLQQQQAGWQRQYQQQQLALQQQAYEAETAAMPPSSWIEQWHRMQGGQPAGTRPPSRGVPSTRTGEQYQRELAQTIEGVKTGMKGAPAQWPQKQGLIRNWGIGAIPETEGVEWQKYEFVPVGEGNEVGQVATGVMPSGTQIIQATYPSGEVFFADVASGEKWVGKPPTERKPSTGLFKPIQRAAPTPTPRTPPAPPGLSGFVPSQVTGQPITRARTTTPSGQQWGQTPWSQREMLRGYTGWAGYRPYEDIMQHMWAMQPATPAGAGRQRWQPARQWA